MSNKQNKNITKRDEDFAKWYTDIVREANLACYSNVKGCIVIEPNGYAIWENIQKELDKMFKETGHKNISMPLLIPENLIFAPISFNAFCIRNILSLQYAKHFSALSENLLSYLTFN